MSIESYVPCNGCTLCCQGHQAVPLMDELGERAEDFDTEPGPGGVFVLRHKPNGDCAYLDRAKGCTIYERRPAVCRGFDCAGAYKRAGHAARRAELIAAGVASAAVFERGHQLIKAGFRSRAEADRRRLAHFERQSKESR